MSRSGAGAEQPLVAIRLVDCDRQWLGRLPPGRSRPNYCHSAAEGLGHAKPAVSAALRHD